MASKHHPGENLHTPYSVCWHSNVGPATVEGVEEGEEGGSEAESEGGEEEGEDKRLSPDECAKRRKWERYTRLLVCRSTIVLALPTRRQRCVASLCDSVCSVCYSVCVCVCVVSYDSVVCPMQGAGGAEGETGGGGWGGGGQLGGGHTPICSSHHHCWGGHLI